MSEQDELPAEPQAETEEAPAVASPQDPRDRASELAAELERIRSDARQGEKVLIALDPEGPHSSFTVGHVTVGLDPSPVPASVVDSLLTAAAEAGVSLTFPEA